MYQDRFFLNHIFQVLLKLPEHTVPARSLGRILQSLEAGEDVNGNYISVLDLIKQKSSLISLLRKYGDYFHVYRNDKVKDFIITLKHVPEGFGVSANEEEEEKEEEDKVALEEIDTQTESEEAEALDEFTGEGVEWSKKYSVADQIDEDESFWLMRNSVLESDDETDESDSSLSDARNYSKTRISQLEDQISMEEQGVESEENATDTKPKSPLINYYNRMKVSELRIALAERSLLTSGTKSELIARLMKDDEDEGGL